MSEKDEPTYMGQSANQGRVEPTEIFDKEGYAILKCGGTEVVLTFTALHTIIGHISMGSKGDWRVKDTSNISKALNAICCETAQGNRG